LLESLVVRKYLKNNIGFARSSSLLSSDESSKKILKSHSGVDIAFVLYANGRFVVRRRDDCPVDTRSIAGLFEGGGSSGASGGRIKHAVTKEGFSDVLFYLDQSLKNFFWGTI